MSKTLDTLLVAGIQNAIDAKVGACDMFTAFGVSRAVQQTGVKERHNNMKHVVHEYFESGAMPGYDRTLVRVDPSKPEAWVYHPTGTDATTYRPSYQPLPSPGTTPQSFYAANQPTSAPAPTPNPSISSVSFQPPAAKHKPDQRGAVTVPAKVIVGIGAKAGDVLDVVVDGDKIVVSKDGTTGRKYVVNTSNNIRIKRRTWSQIVKTTTGDFDFAESNGQIVVTHK
jgi:bifunctional DNA-binding transcriptional regulator/antitoxin component of YhaV-PrlF toxin-antitoxin module